MRVAGAPRAFQAGRCWLGSVLSAEGRIVTFIVFVRVVVESAGRLVHSFPGDAGCTERTGPGVLLTTPSPHSCHPGPFIHNTAH